MEKDNKDFVKRVSHVFDFHIDEVFKVMTNPLFFKDYSPFFENAKFTKGTDFCTVGSELLIDEPKFLLEVRIKVEDIKIDKFYKKLSVTHTYLKPFQLKNLINYHFLWNTVESTTVFIAEIIYENQEQMLKLESTNEKERKKFYDMIQKVLIKINKNFVQTESIVINESIDKVWEAISDMRNFIKHVPIVGYKVEYEGDPKEIDTIVHVYFQTQDREHHMKVIQVDNNPDKKDYALKFFAGKPKSPKQILKFSLIKLEETCCLVKFRHVYKKCLKYCLIEKISNEKKNILNLLKNSLEHGKVQEIDFKYL
jgi:desulfoferrodoxin (superoxide reductase-like protein)